MININQLHISSDPKLLFMANDIAAKGKSNKTYTIKIVNDKHNDELLSNIFSNKSQRTISFDAAYTIELLQLRGRLLISSVDKISASAIFISGNGTLWDAFSNISLSDIDFSELDHSLTVANMYESGDIVYDLTDRGKFISDTVIDISERYPSIRISKLFQIILNSQGFNIEWQENLFDVDIDNLYLLFTQDNNIRNSSRWESEDNFDVTLSGSGSDSGYGSSAVSMILSPTFTVVTDKGSNVSGNTYVVSEDGTYRFLSTLYIQTVISSGSIYPGTLTVSLIAATDYIYKRTIIYPATPSPVTTVETVHTLDTKPIELQAGDIVTIYIWFSGTSTATGAWTSTLDFYQETNLYNILSRYYGADSTVEINALMPDMLALDFLSKISNYINLNTFYRDELHTLQIEHGRKELVPIVEITPVDVSEILEEKSNYTLKFSTDKMQPPDDIYVDFSSVGESRADTISTALSDHIARVQTDGGTIEDITATRTLLTTIYDLSSTTDYRYSNNIESEISFSFSRTLISYCERAFNETDTLIPVLWSDGDPLDWSQNFDPPAWSTKGNLRILEFEGMADGDYFLTSGENYLSNISLKTTYPKFKEPDIEAFHRYELDNEGTSITITSRIDVSKLYDQTYFKNPVFVVGYGRFWMDEAEQIKGDIYKIKLSR